MIANQLPEGKIQGDKLETPVRVAFKGSPMLRPVFCFRVFVLAATRARLRVLIFSGALALTLAITARVAAQQPAPAPLQDNPPAAQQTPAAQTQQPAPAAPAAPAESQPAQAPAQQPAAAPNSPTHSAELEITEDQLKAQLIGKELFLRGGYLENTLTFNEHGALIGHSAQGSYTLSGIQINKAHLEKHKLELEGDRYGLHFLGALPYEDPTKAVDRVKITPKKKVVRITIDRELVVKPKQEKDKKKAAGPVAKATTPTTNPAAPQTAASAATPTAAPAAASAAPAPAATPGQPAEASDASQAQAGIAAAPEAERPADAKSVTTTISPAHANKVLQDALANVFAQGFDDRMMDSMPGFWKLYYQAAADKTDYRPKDPAVLRQNMVDTKARLTSTFEPPSNQYAQDYGVAGMCQYHVVIAADGKPGEIAVARPIGFGLDESAVDSIRRATFEPATKDGKPVPVLLDLDVVFRIYSKRTSVAGQTPDDKQASPTLPGPYSAQH
jgi:outer membrane biosynthesis protein TonB